MIIHTVKKNESVSSIAKQYGVSSGRIISDNSLNSLPYLVVGQALVILIPEVIHTVKKGDTPLSVANEYGITLCELYQRNPSLIVNGILFTGEQLVIKNEQQGEKPLSVYGFVYPNVSQNVFKRELPFVSACACFSYGFDTDGNLTEINDRTLISEIYDNKAAPYMVLSSVTRDGNFDGRLASKVFNDIKLQNTVINNAVKTMKEKGYLGIDIDFEYVDGDDRDAYSEFIRNITAGMNAEGFTVNVDLAPKYSSAQQGTLYEGHDYAKIGSGANSVMLMTYEWGYTYGPPRAIAPINEVRRVARYAASEIQNSKIYLGIPNYAYDWKLPYRKGTTRAVGISNEYAVKLAADNGAEIQFDESSASPYFDYTARDGSKHTVWFEDVRSIEKKFDLIDELKFKGAGYWNLMNPFVQNWAYVGNRYKINKIE